MVFLPLPDKSAAFHLRQFAGLYLFLFAGAIVVLAYDKSYVPNIVLTSGFLAVSIVALLLHESRPFKVCIARFCTSRAWSSVGWEGIHSHFLAFFGPEMGEHL